MGRARENGFCARSLKPSPDPVDFKSRPSPCPLIVVNPFSPKKRNRSGLAEISRLIERNLGHLGPLLLGERPNVIIKTLHRDSPSASCRESGSGPGHESVGDSAAVGPGVNIVIRPLDIHKH